MNYNLGRMTVRMVGHWLGLCHMFEEDGCDGVGDNITDMAPEASGVEGYPVSRITCSGGPPDPLYVMFDPSCLLKTLFRS